MLAAANRDVVGVAVDIPHDLLPKNLERGASAQSKQAGEAAVCADLLDLRQGRYDRGLQTHACMLRLDSDVSKA